MKYQLAIPTFVILAALLFGNSWADDIIATANITNDAPNITNILLNGGADISLTANQTTTILGTIDVTDTNGCSQIQNATATLYRTNLTGGSGAPDNNASHYSVLCSSNGDCLGGADTTESFTCTFEIVWYAEPTDVGSLYENTNWTINVTVTDSVNETHETDVQEMQTLTSMSVSDASITFGSIPLGSDTGASNKNLTLMNTGNEPFDAEIKGFGAFDGDGFCMTCSTGDINVDYLQFDTNSFVYGVGQQMADVEQEIDLDLQQGNDTEKRPESMLYFGLGLPGSGISGTCSGTIVINAFSDPFLD